MLDSTQSIKIYNKLVDLDYPISKITIYTDNFSYIEIIFSNKYDFEKFRHLIFDLLYVDISSGYNHNSNQLTLYVNIDVNFLSKMTYPEFTKELNIFSTIKSENVISLGLLPSVLEKIIIISIVPFDLSNLPNQLLFLDLTLSTGVIKFNFDYLPESLKILKLSYTDNSTYDLNDFQNLPSSLNEIYIGDMFFCSIEDVIKNYYKNITRNKN